MRDFLEGVLSFLDSAPATSRSRREAVYGSRRGRRFRRRSFAFRDVRARCRRLRRFWSRGFGHGLVRGQTVFGTAAALGRIAARGVKPFRRAPIWGRIPLRAAFLRQLAPTNSAKNS